MKAIRDGIFDLIRPVITSTLGLCVPIMRWIPAALAFCARRHIEVSTSSAAVIIRSASSSIIITICGINSFSGSPAVIALYDFISRIFTDSISSRVSANSGMVCREDNTAFASTARNFVGEFC